MFLLRVKLLKVLNLKTFFIFALLSNMKLELLRDDILLKLPSFTEEITRPTSSGFEFSTLKSQTYDPVSGVVLKHSDNCNHVQTGDTVFFQIFTFTNAKERCYGDDNPDFDEYKPFTHYAWKQNGEWFMIIRESSLYFALRGQDIVPLNGYTLARPIEKAERYSNVSTTGLLSVDIAKENYKANQAIVFRSTNPLLKEGNTIQTLRHCDILLEEKLNCPVLPDDFFIIETKNIISCTKQ